MVPALILALSAVAMTQFGLYLWRAAIISIAAESYSDGGSCSGGGGKRSNPLHKHDFHSLSAIHDICPTFERPNMHLQLVRAYYRAVQVIGNLCEERISPIANWAAVELDLCTRCAAVLVDQRRRSTQACFVKASTF
jgi:hypothetical protein